MHRYENLPPLPERINKLDQLAVDLWWSWNAEGREVFRKLDYTLWRQTAHNPVRMLSLVPAAKLAAAAGNPQFLAAYDLAVSSLDAARAIVAAGRCPLCGAPLRRNTSVAGWWQCAQSGAPQWRERPADPPCGWQTFTE